MTSPDLIFICVFDSGSKELGLNHLTSLRRQKIDNYMAYVTDDETYKYINSKGFNVTKEDISDKIPTYSKDFGSNEFNLFSYIRYKISNRLLKEGKAVWYMDVDTVVLGDLNWFYKMMMNNGSKIADMLFQNDLHMLCTGCSLYMPTDGSIDFTKHVYQNASTKMNDQNFIGFMFKDGKKPYNFSVFHYMEFPNGLLYFKETDVHEIPDEMMRIKTQFRNDKYKKVFFVHANWMIGVGTKIKALQNNDLWFI
jgi:hypothetical protein